MMVMGDEVRRTQGGSNNAYCQDNETSWFDWTLLTKHADVHRFVTLLNARRLRRDVEHERRRESLSELIRKANKTWHGVKLDQPDWRDDSHSIAFTVETPLAEHAGGRWRRWIDTALDSPHDIVPWQSAPAVPVEKPPAASPGRQRLRQHLVVRRPSGLTVAVDSPSVPILRADAATKTSVAVTTLNPCRACRGRSLVLCANHGQRSRSPWVGRHGWAPARTRLG